MRTNIDIDEALINEAIKLYGFKTRRETVEEALKLLVAQGNQRKIRKYRGKIVWEGDLDKMRIDK